VLLSPLLVLIAVLVRIFLGGPILFRQQRTGFNKQPFTILKFRTLRASTVTRVGQCLRHTGIDELPQFVNVCRGQMSVVGPRPLTATDVARLGWSDAAHDWRFSAKPGITGLSQLLTGRGARSSERLDRLYLRRQSLCLDVQLIALSLAVNVLGKRRVRRWIRGKPCGRLMVTAGRRRMSVRS